MTEKPYPPQLVEFQRESNRIEGIIGVSPTQIEALQALLAVRRMDAGVLSAYVRAVQPDAVLRSNVKIPGVHVGSHIAPPSGQKLMTDLCALLDRANWGYGNAVCAHEVHCAYETLHPFTDGNGRSGRAVAVDAAWGGPARVPSSVLL